MGKNDQKLRINTTTLRNYASKLKKINRITEDLELALEAVCTASDSVELRLQMRPEVLTSGRKSVDRCIRYLQDTAADFESLERELSRKM